MLLPISSNEIGVNVGTTATATQSSDRIPQAVVCFPSSLLKTSDGKIVRQLLTSIKKKKKNAAPYISSLVTLARTDGVANAKNFTGWGCFSRF